LQRFFERIGVRLVHFIAEIAILDPAPIRRDTKLGISNGDFFDGNDDFHRTPPRY